MIYADLATACFSFAVYLLFAGTVSANELVVAAVLAGLTALWAHLIRKFGRRQFAVSRELFIHALRGSVDLIVGTCRAVTPLLLAATSGASAARFHFSPFHYGRPDDPTDAARRAVAVLIASFAPDRFVVGVGEQSILFHQFVCLRDPDPRWPE